MILRRHFNIDAPFLPEGSFDLESRTFDDYYLFKKERSGEFEGLPYEWVYKQYPPALSDGKFWEALRSSEDKVKVRFVQAPYSKSIRQIHDLALVYFPLNEGNFFGDGLVPNLGISNPTRTFESMSFEELGLQGIFNCPYCDAQLKGLAKGNSQDELNGGWIRSGLSIVGIVGKVLCPQWAKCIDGGVAFLKLLTDVVMSVREGSRYQESETLRETDDTSPSKWNMIAARDQEGIWVTAFQEEMLKELRSGSNVRAEARHMIPQRYVDRIKMLQRNPKLFLCQPVMNIDTVMEFIRGFCDNRELIQIPIKTADGASVIFDAKTKACLNLELLRAGLARLDVNDADVLKQNPEYVWAAKSAFDNHYGYANLLSQDTQYVSIVSSLR